MEMLLSVLLCPYLFIFYPFGLLIPFPTLFAWANKHSYGKKRDEDISFAVTKLLTILMLIFVLAAWGVLAIKTSIDRKYEPLHIGFANIAAPLANHPAWFVLHILVFMRMLVYSITHLQSMAHTLSRILNGLFVLIWFGIIFSVSFLEKSENRGVNDNFILNLCMGFGLLLLSFVYTRSMKPLSILIVAILSFGSGILLLHFLEYVERSF